jgi:hypothetical protein
MSYNYLGLINDVTARFNETALTSSTFGTAVGFYTTIKEALNSSLRHINQAHFQWPFNHQVEEETLEAGVCRYSPPQNSKYVDYGTFRIRRNSSLGVEETRILKEISYSEYLSNYIDWEDETDTSRGSIPQYVAATPDGEYAIAPMPDEDYDLVYEYYTYPVDLVNSTDIPTVPERFRHVVIDGAMYYAYMFRDNVEQAGIAQNKFESGLKQMRLLLVNDATYFRGV